MLDILYMFYWTYYTCRRLVDTRGGLYFLWRQLRQQCVCWSSLKNMLLKKEVLHPLFIHEKNLWVCPRSCLNCSYLILPFWYPCNGSSLTRVLIRTPDSLWHFCLMPTNEQPSCELQYLKVPLAGVEGLTILILLFVFPGTLNRKRKAKVASLGTRDAISRTICMGDSSIIWCQYHRRCGWLFIISKQQPTASWTPGISFDGGITWFRWKAYCWFKGRVCKCASSGRCAKSPPSKRKLHRRNASGWCILFQ